MTERYCKKCNNLISRDWEGLDLDWENIHQLIKKPLLEVSHSGSYVYMLPEPRVHREFFKYLPLYVVKEKGKTKLEPGYYCQECYNKFI